MPQSSLKHAAILAVATSLLTWVGTGCRGNGLSDDDTSQPPVPSPPSEMIVPTAQPQTAARSALQPPSTPKSPEADLYQQAIDQASSAFTLSRSAQSNDDWKLAARRWQKAIEMMASVPHADPHYAQAQRKVTEYRNNLTIAQQHASRSTTALYPDGRIVVRPQPSPSPRVAPVPTPITTAARTHAAANPANSSENVSSGGTTGQQVFYAPIVRREGNTPVIRVTFNGNQSFDMIVDTGASGTLITQSMAQLLDVKPVSTALVNTASQRGVVIPLGYVNSIEVDGAVSTNVLVAIAGPELRTGLLGHDFFGQYDVTVRQNQVEFRVR